MLASSWATVASMRPGGAEGVAERDGAAVDVEARGVHFADRGGAPGAALGEGRAAQHLHHRHHLRGEGLVEIDAADSFELQPCALQRLGDGPMRS